MNFVSDNVVGAAPEILHALSTANEGWAASYGADPWTESVEARLSALFEREVGVVLTSTGTAANGLALATLTTPVGAVLVDQAAHVHTDECGAPEFFTGGAKLLPIATKRGKLTLDDLRGALDFYAGQTARKHRVRPQVLSLAQPSEYGLVYGCAELRALCELASDSGLSVHMDGARFANALVAQACSAAEATWKQGVDVLCFGATKNGALAAEAIVFFDPEKADEARWRCKRSGHLLSKSRFLGAQFDAYLTDERWIGWATHANRMARRLSNGLVDLPGVEVVHQAQVNSVFATLPHTLESQLGEASKAYFPWVYPGDQWDGRLRRFVTSYATTEKHVDHFLATCVQGTVPQ